MINKFTNYTPSSRIWIFQADKRWDAINQGLIEKSVKSFLSEWAAHEKKLEVDFTTYANVFLIIAVNDSVQNATGCSIDELMHFINDLGEKTNIDWFNRNLFAVEKSAGDVELINKSTFQTLFQAGLIDTKTTVFDNTITTLRDLYSRWRLPLDRAPHRHLLLQS